MIKILTVLLSVFVLFLFGCGSSNDTEIADAADTNTYNYSDDYADAYNRSDDGQSHAFVRGIIDGNLYTNEYLGLTFTKPDHWVFGSDEDLANAMGIASEFMSAAGMELTEDMLNAQSVAELLVANTGTGSSVNVTVENLAQTVRDMTMTESQFLDITRQHLEGIMPEYMAEIVGSVEIGGNVFEGMRAVIGQTGMVQYIYVRRIDGFMMQIIISGSAADDEFNEILTWFSN